MIRKIRESITLAIIVALVTLQTVSWKPVSAQTHQPSAGVPIFQVDTSWPKMEGNWIFGAIGGIAVDPSNDHVWLLQRPLTLLADETLAAQKPPCVGLLHLSASRDGI